MQCKDINSSCPKRYKCEITNKTIRFEDIWQLFQEDQIPCSAEIVFLDSRGNGDIRDKVIAKRMIDDCYYTYTCKDNYIYLYGGDLLERMLVWAREPQYFSRRGHLGSHLSIGLRENRTVDIHETIYETFLMNNNEPIIGTKKTMVYYNLQRNNDITRKKDSKYNVYDTTIDTWNEIRCVLQDRNKLQSGGNTRLNLTDDKSLYRLFPLQKTPHRIRNGKGKDNDLISKVKSIAEQMLSNKHFAIMAISYVPPHETSEFIKKVTDACNEHNVVMLRDTYFKTCVLLFNFFI